MTRLLLVTDSAVASTGMAECTRLVFKALLSQYPGTYEVVQLGINQTHAICHTPWPIQPTRTLTGPN